MGSKIESLVRSFLRSDADGLYLVPGEKIFMMKGLGRAIVGREPLSDDSLQAVSFELVPSTPMHVLSESEYRLTYRPDPASDAVEVTFGLVSAKPALMISRAGAVAADLSEAAAAKSGRSQPMSLQEIDRAIAREWRSQAFPAITPSQVQAALAQQKVSTPPASGSGSTQSMRKLSARTGAHAAVKPIDEILFLMADLQASDVHLSVGQSPVFRIHGELVAHKDLAKPSSSDLEKLLNPIFPEEHRQEFNEKHDAEFVYELEGYARYRVNVFRDRNGVSAVLRQIPLEVQLARGLEFPPAVVQLADFTSGLVLVTGATGSGKSTTLAALLDRINESRAGHILTLEDPIEFVHQSKRSLVNQREIGTHVPGFVEGLRAALRADPDVVFVGQLRELPAIEACLEIAETGHLVFGSLHTTSAASTVERIIDLFPADRRAQVQIMLADCLRAIVVQTLCKRVGGGRVAAFEIFLNTPAARNLLRDGKAFQIPAMLQSARNQGMISMTDSLLDHVRAGIVEPREAYLKANDKAGLVSGLRSLGVPFPQESAAVAPGPDEDTAAAAARR
ncbi:MAG: PilT/PilU family type 4a pilus ATPase [Thermoanaerobaculia bacterium]|nr:hypothetical protein [Thermoanaerobaculia bacterium]MCK6682485.1 PilT/PilU family type 4a pilus ATPase [Thermoanaerobaculia bacterium]